MQAFFVASFFRDKRDQSENLWNIPSICLDAKGSQKSRL